MSTPTKYNLERNVKNCFFSLRDRLAVKVSEFLSELDLSPMKGELRGMYEDEWHYRHSPGSMVKLLLFMRLKGIRFQAELTRHLEKNPADAQNLGFVRGPDGKYSLPSRQAVNHFANKRCNENVGGLVDFLFRKIKGQAKKKGVVFDSKIFEGASKKKVADRSRRRQKSQRLREACKVVRKDMYPHIGLQVNYNSVYGKNVFLDMLTHIAMTHDFTENGSLTYGEMSGRDMPSADTLLYHLKKYEDRDAVMNLFVKAGEVVIGMARSSGMLDRPVDVAIDYTEHPYYGSSQTDMVARTKFQKGTWKCFRYATINIVSKGRRITLFALPVTWKDRKEDVVAKLIMFAKSKVKVRHVYLDRGFYSVSVLNRLKDFGVKFIIPARRTPTMKREIARSKGDRVVPYTMTGTNQKRTMLRLAIVLNDDGTKFGFLTNIESSDPKRIGMLYSRRWGIETSYRMKNLFRPRTTSKNYVIRLFYFLYSVLLYNVWILVNVMVAKFVFGKILGDPVVTAKYFATVLYMSVT